MDAIKLIPQSFFDFLARLVPGALALAILLDTVPGGERWRILLETFAAGKLHRDNITVVAVVIATVGAYVAGQLAAPFGKAMQRFAEAIAAIPTPPVASAPSPQAVPPPRMISRIGHALWPPSKGMQSEGTGDYDWLRVNAPEIGALAAKIRAEQTMFCSMSAVLLAAAIMEIMLHSWSKGAACLCLGLACEVRGYTVGRTQKQTSAKLKRAVQARMANEATRSAGPAA